MGISQMKIDQIRTRSPFNTIFDIDEHILLAIKENMEENGYDPAFPIILWGKIVIDGHTRLEAAKMAGIKDVPIIQRTFDSKYEALEYAIHNQRDRRNLTEGELLRCIEALDKRMHRGKHLQEYPRDSKGHTVKPDIFKVKNIGSEWSHIRTAKLLKIGRNKVSDARVVLDSGDEKIRKKIESGKITIRQAAKEIRKAKKLKESVKKSTKPTFNYTNDNIEWAKWTWNPVSGCKHGCKYCYARDIANRYYPHKFEPHYYPERLQAPKNTKIPKEKIDELGIYGVFVCSMGDLLGEWVPKEWIEQVIKVMKEYDQWNYLLLTKNPKRYLEFEWPKTCWLGATADIQERANRSLEVFTELRKKCNNILFLSCEPLMEAVRLPKDTKLDWLIIGGRSKSTGMPAGQPKWRWVEDLLFDARKHKISVYFKPNLTVRPKEYPKYPKK